MKQVGIPLASAPIKTLRTNKLLYLGAKNLKNTIKCKIIPGPLHICYVLSNPSGQEQSNLLIPVLVALIPAAFVQIHHAKSSLSFLSFYLVPLFLLPLFLSSMSFFSLLSFSLFFLFQTLIIIIIFIYMYWHLYMHWHLAHILRMRFFLARLPPSTTAASNGATDTALAHGSMLGTAQK